MAKTKSITYLLVTLAEGTLIATNIYLFSYGYPDSTRLSLWEEGGKQLFNSNPKNRIYFYANYKLPPDIPYIWSRTFSDFNLAITILSFWCFIAKFILRCCGAFNKWIELYLQFCVVPFWIVCLVGQQSSDISDPEHSSQFPWYLTHSCSVADESVVPVCKVAQSCFTLTIITLLFYIAYVWRTLATLTVPLVQDNRGCQSEVEYTEASCIVEEVTENMLLPGSWEEV